MTWVTLEHVSCLTSDLLDFRLFSRKATLVGPSLETIVTFMNRVHGVHCLNLDVFLLVTRYQTTVCPFILSKWLGSFRPDRREQMGSFFWTSRRILSDFISEDFICAIYFIFLRRFWVTHSSCINAIFYPCIFVFLRVFI